MDTIKGFGERLEAVRKIKGLTQEQLAKQLNICRVAIVNWEKKDGNPTAKNMIKLASALGVSIDWLLGISENTEIMSIIDERIRKFSSLKEQDMKLVDGIVDILIKRDNERQKNETGGT
jgi:transcriptional regulator with XRE-family HTH domain